MPRKLTIVGDRGKIWTDEIQTSLIPKDPDETLLYDFLLELPKGFRHWKKGLIGIYVKEAEQGKYVCPEENCNNLMTIFRTKIVGVFSQLGHFSEIDDISRIVRNNLAELERIRIHCFKHKTEAEDKTIIKLKKKTLTKKFL